MKWITMLMVVWYSQHVAIAQRHEAVVFSPDKKTKLTVSLNDAGEPTYSIDFNKKTVVGRSKLGFSARQTNFYDSFRWVENRTASRDDYWKPVWGEEAEIRDQHNELLYVLKNVEDWYFAIRFRVFNDGVGFRYELSEGDAPVDFTQEHTQFQMMGNHTCWWNPLDYDSNEHTYTESTIAKIDVDWYRKNVQPFNQHLPVQHGVNTPVTMRTADGVHLAIAEADLTNFGALQLEIDPKTFLFKAHVVPTADSSILASITLPFATPWRCVLISPDAAGILKNRIILNLNDPCAIEGDLSWIKPQKYVGVWWEMHVGKSTWEASPRHGATTENTRKYIDFAAKHGFDGILVEGWNEGWDDWFGKMKPEVFNFTKSYADYDVPQLAQLANQKGVKIIMHHETAAAVPSYERQMNDAYRFMKKHGMNTVKTGYVGRILPRKEWHDGQFMVNHYLRVAQQTAQQQIMVNMHESVRPSGQHRTYPNWLACEAARGQEYNAWSSGNPPDHEIVLAFTRLLGGPMDYTPGIFAIRANQFDPQKKEQVHTTVAKQLALYVVLYSPLQMAADLPENYEARPEVLQFIKDVPVDWDETRILHARVGDYITTARRQKGTGNWFVGSITDENPRQQTLQLDFLEKGKKYEAVIYEDGAGAHYKTNPLPVNIRRVPVKYNQKLNLKLAASGGAAIAIFEIK